MLFICLSIDMTVLNKAPMFFTEFNGLITSEQTRIDSRGVVADDERENNELSFVALSISLLADIQLLTS